MRASQIRMLGFGIAALLSAILFIMWHLGWISIVVALIIDICIFISLFFLNMGLKKAIEDEQRLLRGNQKYKY